MKRIFVTLFLVVLLLFAYALADDYTKASEFEYTRSGSFEYAVLSDGTGEIVNYFGSDSTLLIPAEIDGNLSETSLTISAVAPFRTGLQLMINAFMDRYSL